MTGFQIAYLMLAVGGWLAFAVVTMWATQRTAALPKAAAPQLPFGAVAAH